MALLTLLLALAAAGTCGAAAPPDLHRVGNRLLDRRTGQPVVLKGMAMMGGEYSCVHGHNRIFAGPANETVVDGMAAWGINAIRLPMNEDCWLGQHGVDPRVSGARYQSRFAEFIELLLGRGMVVVLDLHWTNSSGGLAEGQDLFLSSSSPRFWASVASHPALRNRPGVVFELFNEPHDVKGGTLSPSCFLDGVGCPHAGFTGYNQAVEAVRKTAGATNLLLFAGKNWNFDLEWLLAHWPTDPIQNCAAAWHPYEFKCRDFSCRSKVADPLTSKYPIFVTEWGEQCTPVPQQR